MGVTLDEDPGTRLPTALASRKKMLEDLPRAERHIPDDIREILLGEDA